MNDQEKTKDELIAELAVLRRQIAEETAASEAALIQVAPIGIHHCDFDLVTLDEHHGAVPHGQSSEGGASVLGLPVGRLELVHLAVIIST